MFPNRLAVIACAAAALFLAACPSEPEPPPAVVASVTLLNLQPQPIQTGTDKQAVNNCGGTDDATYTVAKEREITHLLDVGSEFSVSADGAVKVFGTGIALGTAVAAKVGATYGKRDTVARTIEITVDPKTMVEYEVSLQDVYQVGEAEVTVGGQRTTIPFRFFDDFVLVLLGTRELPCPGTPTAVPTFTAAPEGGRTPTAQAADLPVLTVTPIPPIETSTPTDVPEPTVIDTPTSAPPPPTNTPAPLPPTATPAPVIIDVTLQGSDGDGTVVSIPSSGAYQLSYIGGAFSPWSSDDASDNRGWATHTLAYVNRPVEWGTTPYGRIGPINFDAYIGTDGYYFNPADAIASTQGRSASLGYLNAGDSVTVIVLEEQGRYGDNRGAVELRLTGYPY